MPTIKGTIRRNDLEGGFWELVADDGERYQLEAPEKDLCQDGKRVEVEGNVQKSAFGIGMTGPYLQITSWKPA
ncbi:MAG TPA: DUF5818 domain-containing protein [Kofleriaceae bacterium]|nr:DUF5818 domain-containing protein [Kofleriaceae bacterium]